MPFFKHASTIQAAFAASLCLCAMSPAQSAELPSIKMLSCEAACGTWTKPVVVQQDTNYPQNEVPKSDGYSAEAYVVIRFTVTAEGAVADPVVERLVGPEDFAQNSVANVRRWRYKPATLNGVAVARPNEVVALFYSFPEERSGARQAVNDAYQKATVLYRDKMYDEAKDDLLGILALGRLNFYERMMSSYLLALIEFDQKNYATAANHISDALLQDGKFLDEPTRASAMRLAIRLDAATGQFADALDTFAKLQKIVDIDAKDPDAQIIAKVKARPDDPAPISAMGAVPNEGSSGAWHHTLLRRNFGFVLHGGKVDRFELRCDQQEVQSAITESAEWHVPKNWSSCDLDVYGAPGATFQVLEAIK